MNSVADPRNADVKYERYTANIFWTTANAQKSYRNKLGLNLTKDLNEGQAGNNEYEGIYIKAKNSSVNITDNFNLKLQHSFFRQLTADLGLTYGNQESVRRNFVNSQAVPFGNAMESSVYYGSYTPPQYFNYNHVDGKPLDIFADVELAGVYKSKKEWVHQLSAGINYRHSDNFGRGRYGNNGQFSNLSALRITANGNRPYDFDASVASISQYAAYVQDNISKRFANRHTLNIKTGVRYDLQNSYSTVSPRMNAAYSMGKFILRGGTGLSTKAPSLNMIYTGPRYIDLLLGDYRLPGVYSVAIIQTVVAPANNADLKPSKSWRSEIGFDWKTPVANVSLPGYHNYLYDGFTAFSNVININKAKIQVTQQGTEIPTFEIIGTENMNYVQSLQTNG